MAKSQNGIAVKVPPASAIPTQTLALTEETKLLADEATRHMLDFLKVSESGEKVPYTMCLLAGIVRSLQ